MSNFLLQIEEDIKHIQDEWIECDSRLNEDYYAFNYWILTHLFDFNEEDIKYQITDRCEDKGIDAFVYYEDENVLYLIQNKYRKDDTIETSDINKILLDGIETSLNDGNYYNQKLQESFNKMQQKGNYKIYIQFYVANKNQYKQNVVGEVASLNKKISNIEIQLYNINDIEGLYYDDTFKENKHFEFDIKEIENDREMRMTKDNNNTKINSKYYAVKVPQIYYMKQAADEQKYELFDKNIRDFLGLKSSQSINNGIVNTLLDEQEKQNFFYYNNGITILCDEFKREKGSTQIHLTNPKIINGCQTTNCIVEALNRKQREEENIKALYNSTYVFCKIFSKEVDLDDELYHKIVVSTNSQNPIKPEDLVSMEVFFLQLQEKFRKRGWLLLVKASDTNTFEKTITDSDFMVLKNRVKSYADIAGVEIKKLKDLQIDKKKLLRAMLAFAKGSYAANNSTDILKNSSSLFLDFTRKIEKYFTIDTMIYLHILFTKIDGYKRRKPNRLPYLFMEMLGHKLKMKSFEETDFDNYKNKSLEKLSYMFSSKEVFDKIFNMYCKAEEDYIEETKEERGEELEAFRKDKMDEDRIERIIKNMQRYSNDEHIEEYIQ